MTIWWWEGSNKYYPTFMLHEFSALAGFIFSILVLLRLCTSHCFVSRWVLVATDSSFRIWSDIFVRMRLLCLLFCFGVRSRSAILFLPNYTPFCARSLHFAKLHFIFHAFFVRLLSNKTWQIIFEYDVKTNVFIIVNLWLRFSSPAFVQMVGFLLLVFCFLLFWC